MPISTDLNRSPYFDDFNEKDNYYKILFKPSVAVQVRELNQLQTILQNQIERFGDNIFKRGTIIDGCNFIFHNPLPYVKISDSQTDGAPVNVSSFKGFLVKNSANLVSRVVETSDGFEAAAPNLKTLHVVYTNKGSTGSEFRYVSGEELTVYDPALPVSEVDVSSKSSGFTNNDTVVFLSAIAVQNTEGGQTFVNSSGQACTFVVGELITQDITGAVAIIKEVNTSASSSNLILKIKPLSSQLKIGNASSWAFSQDYNITSSCTMITSTVSSVIGKNAYGTVLTDSSGGVVTCSILNGGSGYFIEPHATVAYATANTSAANNLIDALDLRVKTYKAKLTVSTTNGSTGDGIGFSISDGIIYQKGYFSKVQDTFIVVDKYSTFSNNVVGFDTKEEIINFRQDQKLLDNATGFLNQNAPGADRLKLTPMLVVRSKTEADANTNFLPLVEFNNGKPYKQRKTTQFNSLEKVMAQRTYEQSGNYILDKFLIKTVSQQDLTDEVSSYEVAIDPGGAAYINGYRVETYSQYSIDVPKGITTTTKTTEIPISYGNYIKVKELGGLFKFSSGSLVSLYDTAKTYYTGASASPGDAITTAGAEIGKARIRSLTLASGIAGTPEAVYYLYLFDIRMNSGKNFDNVKSIYYNGAGVNDGIADLILSNGKAEIIDAKNSTLVFSSGARALKNANNITYTYRSINDSLTCNTGGIISVSIASSPNEYFPYGSTLSDLEKQSLIVSPLANGISASAVTGTVAVTSGFGNVIGTSTTFLTDFEIGDYILISQSGTEVPRRVTKITNNTHLSVNKVISTSAFTSASVYRYFPQYAPIPLSLRNSRTVTVQSNATLIIDLGTTVSSAFNVAVAYNANKQDSAIPKSVTRKAYVKINTATNSDTNVGPWCLGHGDIIRLREVYQGNTSAVTTSDTKVTTNFWIDHNQRKDYYDLGYLYRNSSYTVPSGVFLLAEFDVLSTKQQGLKTISSYPVRDDLTLSLNTSAINTLEIPELNHDNGEYYDLRDVLDFRPYTTNTAVIEKVSTSAPVNPAEVTESTRFAETVDYKFPAPQSTCKITLEQYLGRVDAVALYGNSAFSVLQGVPSEKPSSPKIPSNSLLLNYLIVPPYPSLPSVISGELQNILNKKISNITATTKRQTDFTITTPINADGLKFNQPKTYTMEDIGSLERRISDLEYYTSLSFTEDRVNNLQIPSSVDTTTNRFKFGFFIDNFTTANFSDIQAPGYKAQIYGYELGPRKKQLKIDYVFNDLDQQTSACIQGDKLILPASTKTIINQNIATEPTTIDIATTTTTFTTTGTEVTNTTTNISQITVEDYSLLQQQFQTYTAQTSIDTRTRYINVTKTRIKIVPDGFIGYFNDPTNTYGVNNDAFSQAIKQGRLILTRHPWEEAIQREIIRFTASKLGGTLFFQCEAAGTVVQGIGYTKDYPANPAIIQRLNQFNEWVTIVPETYTVQDIYRLDAPTVNKDILSITYTYEPSDYTTFRLLRRAYTKPYWFQTYPQQFPVSKEIEETYVEQVPFEEAYLYTRYDPSTETIYSVDVTTNTTQRIEVIPRTTIVETTTSLTTPLFNAKKDGLLLTTEIFNNPKNLSSPTVDLLSYIYNEINK